MLTGVLLSVNSRAKGKYIYGLLKPRAALIRFLEKRFFYIGSR